MTIRDELREMIERGKREESRAFFERKLHRDRVDVYGYVPYNMVSRPQAAGEISFREFICEGAFSESLKNEIKLLYAHGELQLATTRDGSLQLKESKDGIRFRAKILDADVRLSIMDAVDAGELVGASVGFFCDRDRWDRKENIRYVEKGELIEISLCETPCYPQASSCGKVIGTG